MEQNTSRYAPRASQDAAGGLFLIALAAVALWQGAGLDAGTLGQIGPGMLPRALAVLTGLCGIAMLVGAFLADGVRMSSWSLRGPIFVLGAAVAFGLAIRPFGLAVAGPVAIIFGSLASAETRPVEAVVFGVVISAFCIGLFKFALGLPIPVAPWAIGY